MSTYSRKCAQCQKPIPSNLKYCSPACLSTAKPPRKPPTKAPTRPPKRPELFEVSGNTAKLTRVVEGRIRTLDDLIRVCQIDTTEWEVERWTANKWEMGAVLRSPGDDSVVVTELFQVKATLRRRVAIVAAREEIERMKAEWKADEQHFRALVYNEPVAAQPRPALLQIAIPDLHMGKLAWKRETGANYDLKIAESLFDTALARLIDRTAHHAIGRVLFVVGSDLLHTDNPNGTTTKGTPQDTEGRFHKTFWKARQMVTRAIERLRLIAPVDVLMVPGNHDTQTVWHLGDSLECWYHDCPDVAIDNAPTQRKYYEWGKVMLMFTHGDKGKRPDYPLLMATEQPAMFGRTIYREAHTGHIHQLQVREQHGVRVRVSPALCAADAWHTENQYVGNARAAESYVWDRDEGLISQATWTVPQEE